MYHPGYSLPPSCLPTPTTHRDYVPTDDPGLAVPDPHALHGGCPVRAGQKFIVTRWIRASRFW